MPNIFHNSLSLGYPVGGGYPTDGLISRWPLQSDLNDTFGGYNFSRIGGSGDSFTSGLKGNALTFDGTIYYQIDNSTLAGFTNSVQSYSFSIWCKILNTTDQPTVMGTSTSTSTYAEMVAIPANLGAGRGYTAVRSFSGTGDWPWWNRTWNSNWHLFTNTFESGKLYGYIDGVKETQDAAWGAGQGSTRDLGTGMRYFNLGFGYAASPSSPKKFANNSQVQFAYFYNKALSQAEITQLYNSGVPI